MIEFKDNQPVIDLVSKKPRGLLIQLEEQGLLGRRANNKALLQVKRFVNRAVFITRLLINYVPSPPQHFLVATYSLMMRLPCYLSLLTFFFSLAALPQHPLEQEHLLLQAPLRLYGVHRAPLRGRGAS